MMIVSLFLLIYSIYNSIFSTLHYDEAYSYLYYSQRILDFTDIGLANNHPLNSLLIYLSSYYFKFNDFMIRLPNIIFLFFYLLFAVKISKKTQLKLLTFGLLTLYWYLVPNFFSQARGYGIASSIVLFFLYQFLNKPFNNKTILTSITILLVASYAFLGLVPLILSVSIYYLVFVIKNPISFIKKNLIIVLSLSSALIYITHILISVSAEGNPLYGSFNNSFLASTIGFYKDSFLKGIYDFGAVSNNMTNASSFYNASDNIFFVVTLIGLMCFVGLLIYKKEEGRIKTTIVAILCFALLYISSILMHKPFITGRSLLPFYPVIVISIIEILEFIISYFKAINENEAYKRTIGLFLFIALLFNYQEKINKPLFNLSIEKKREEINGIMNESNGSPHQLYYQKQKDLLEKRK